ncbi:hypothetical protein LCP9604111_3240 [Penicillium roqueforti]|uniref:uncharacterized protein n=1 Tax=Penicillium roqueforti TaxID=5082 RepID=UPI00190C04C0|nr:uncharacterized protein LCP9604111_3240 [Penicillium roqueforti]KAF9250338.1 hypothetical protein LCP9604111_3240 [Penicillium roqueforti]
MADPHAGGPESPPTNTQESTDGFTREDLATRTTVENRKRTRSGDAFSPSDPAGRITTKEEVKHNQHVLQEQNEKLYDKVKALQTQIETNPPATATKT